MLRKTLLLLFALLVGCEVTPTPTPTAITFPRIGTTPEFEATVVSWVLQFREQVRDEIIEVNTYSPEVIQAKVSSNEADLIISGLLPPEGWFATPVLLETVVIVVNLENDARSLSVDDLQNAFSGRASSWEGFSGDPIPIQPIVPLHGDSVRAVFEESIMKDASFSPSAFLAPTPNQMLELVQAYEGSIGLILQNDLNESVRQIRIDGINAEDPANGDAEAPLIIEVLAISTDEPTGILREFIGWLQAQGIQ
jgi:hypothetical protein